MQKVSIEHNDICIYGSMILGMIIGCIFFGLALVYDNTGLTNFALEKYDSTVVMNLPQSKIVYIILKKRIIQILLFFLFFLLFSYRITCLFACGGFGIYYGILMCNLIMNYGIKGLGYGVACFFPHYFFYFTVIYIIGKMFSLKTNNRINCFESVNKMRCLITFSIVILLVILALIWEIKYQKFFLNHFFQYLV